MDFFRNNFNIRSQEYYDGLIAKIDRRLNPPQRISGVPDIRYSREIDIDFDKLEKDMYRWRMEHRMSTFQQELMDLIAERNMTSVEFYTKAHMDRKLFSAINCNVDYSPKKDTAIACCMALELTEEEAESLLAKAGYVLTDAKKRDQIIKFCISEKIYDIGDVNYILVHYDEQILK